jgi:6-phosphogluconolactonase
MEDRLVKLRSIPLVGGLVALLLALTVGPAAAGSNVGAVYTLSNSAAGNTVIAYARASNGGLSPLGTFATGGLGSGAGLGSQGPVTLSTDGDWLLAVDAGSDEISSFAVGSDHRLTLADTIASGGDHPISVTIHGSLVYAVNDGGAGNIAGFTIDGAGNLIAIAGSTQPLSSAASQPAQISFSPNGSTLLVAEKATNRITTYAGGAGGVAGTPTWIASAGQTPFGFAFDNKGRAIVSEAFGGAANASTVSSYRVSAGTASLIDGPVATTETAACWVAITNNGKYAYAANTGSGTVTGFRIARNGTLHRLEADGVTGVTGGAPADLDFSRNSKFLYVRAGGSIVAFKAHRDGSLSNLGSTVVQAGIVGLAAS